MNWDLKRPAPDPINLSEPAFKPPWAGDAEGPLAAPGEYKVTLYIEHNGQLQAQGEAQNFSLKPVPTSADGTDYQAVASFQQKTSDLMRQTSSASRTMGEASERLRYLQAALKQTPKATTEHFATLKELNDGLSDLRLRLSGDPIRQNLSESTTPSISSRVGEVAYGHWSTRQMPTETYKNNLEIATNDFASFEADLKAYIVELEKYEALMEAAGAPYTRGRKF